MKRRYAVFALVFVSLCVRDARAGVVWYLNDYDGWAAAAGEVYTIDFETLPDGSPSVASTPITLEFNYADQGVTFSGPVTTPFIAGNSMSGFSLRVDSSPNLDPNWIIADLVQPASGVGIEFVSYSRLSLFDSAGTLIDEELLAQQGLNFLGAISTEPVFLVTTDRNSSAHGITSFFFSPIPEPTSGAPILLGLSLVCARQRGRRNT